MEFDDKTKELLEQLRLVKESIDEISTNAEQIKGKDWAVAAVFFHNSIATREIGMHLAVCQKPMHRLELALQLQVLAEAGIKTVKAGTTDEDFKEIETINQRMLDLSKKALELTGAINERINRRGPDQ